MSSVARTRPSSTTPPRLTRRDFAILGQQPDAPLDLCIRAYDVLAREVDPRHRPPDQQWLWLNLQNDLDETVALMCDLARIGVAA